MTRKEKSMALIAAALMAYLGFSPLFLLPGVALLPDDPALPYLLPLTALALCLAAGLLHGKKRRIAGFVAAAALQMSVWGFVLYSLSPLSMLLLLPCLLLMLLFAKALSGPPRRIWPASLLGWGVLLHVAGQILARVALFAAAGPALALLFSVYIIACLFLFNRYAVADAADAEGTPPAKLLSLSRRILAFFSALALLIGNWGAFAQGLGFVWTFIRDTVAAVLSWLSGLFAPAPLADTPGGAGGGMDLSELGEMTEPSAFVQFLEKLLIGAASIAAAIAILFFLYIIFKRVRVLLIKLLAKLKDYSRTIGDEYADRTESLLDFGKAAQTVRDRWQSHLKRRPKPPAWERLSPRERVRYAYARWAARKAATSPTQTAREALESGAETLPPGRSGEVASLYERARYSEHPVTADEAEAMRKDIGV